MTYSGNPSLALAIRERILGTFRHTLDLAERGSRHEASLGCDFILQMDPQFGPARALQDRLADGSGPVEVGDLRSGVLDAAVAGDDGAGPGELPSGGDLDLDLDLSLDPDLDAVAAEPASGLRMQIEERLDERDFAGVQVLAAHDPEAVAADPEVKRLVETATARQEAAPYVQRFLDSGRQALAEGDRARAESLLDKARSLDPTHPGVEDMAARLTAPAPEARPATAAAPPPAAADLSWGGEATADHDGSDRISELLDEGQQAFDRGDHQSAIDAWSRIFLIDIDHQEAGRRIDEARRLKAEHERRVEEAFHDAAEHFDRGDFAAARSGLDQVLELAPGHLAARELLERVERAERTSPGPAPAAPSPAAVPVRPAEPAEALELKEEILVPPEPGAEPARRDDAERSTLVAVRAQPGPRRRFVLIGSVVLALVVLALGFLYLNRERLFPNAAEPAPTAAAAVDPIARATRLHEAGRTAMAINQLRRLPPTDPLYEEAQALISQWEASGQQPEAAEAGSEAPSPEALGRRAELVAEAEQALGRGENLAALDALDAAAAVAPLDEPEAVLRSTAEAALAPLAAALDLYRDGQYERALPRLWRLREEEQDNLDLRRLIVDSYYNLAVRDLQRGDAKGAAGKLREALELVENDPELERHLRFAETYEKRNKDLLYRIYVKYLPLR